MYAIDNHIYYGITAHSITDRSHICELKRQWMSLLLSLIRQEAFKCKIMYEQFHMYMYIYIIKLYLCSNIQQENIAERMDACFRIKYCIRLLQRLYNGIFATSRNAAI